MKRVNLLAVFPIVWSRRHAQTGLGRKIGSDRQEDAIMPGEWEVR